MDKSFKPSGYNSVSPYFVINEAQKFVDLLKKLFNASEKRRYNLADGKIMHLELQIDDSIIMVGDASDKFPVYNHLMHIYVKDVDEVFERAMQLGCESIYSPKEREGDPNKRGAFKDFAGNTWTIATQL
jgi:PhnB protein